jgi:hypothetical protein
MKQIALIALISLVSFNSFAQNEEPYVKKGMLVLLSTKNYAAAKKTALQAAQKLSYKLDLRGLVPNKITGLSYSEKECENEGGYPCYIARGRYDDGAFISIEYSDAIDGFTKGYYVVIAAAGSEDITRPALIKARKIYKDAYVKTSNVYVGCMH